MRGLGNAAGAGLPVVRITTVDDMAAFDELPPMLRAAVRDVSVNISASLILDYWLNAPGDCVERAMAIMETLRDLPRQGGV